MLEKWGYNVVTAESQREAEEIIGQNETRPGHSRPDDGK